MVVAQTVADAERAAGPDTLLLAAEIYQARTGQLLDRLSDLPGDRLVLEPTARAREMLAPGIRISTEDIPTDDPGCDLPEAKRAGGRPGPTDTYQKVGDTAPTRCYGGALVRYESGERTITVVGSADFGDQRLAAERGQRRAGDESGRQPVAAHLVRPAAAGG